MAEKKTVLRECGYCRAEFYAKPSDVKRGQAKYCSRSCSAMVNSAGENNPRFNGWASRDNVKYKNRFREKYPEKAKAHDITRNAIARGVLVRQPCETCGETKVEAHHDDYSKPLNVRWLCKQCHADFHAECNKKPGKPAPPRVLSARAKLKAIGAPYIPRSPRLQQNLARRAGLK